MSTGRAGPRAGPNRGVPGRAEVFGQNRAEFDRKLSTILYMKGTNFEILLNF